MKGVPVERARASARRRGAILLQVSFLLFALLGLVALVIDMGIARSTQVFLQAGADTASVEGLRLRNLDVGDPSQSDVDRRVAASRSAALVFDEDLDLSTGPARYLLGGGPRFETGVGGIDDPAGGLLVSQGPYLPDLQPNAGNEAFGDLVAGTFTAVDPANPGNPVWHVEDGLYQRPDFTAADAAGSPSAPAFLARLRRTNDRLGLDNQVGVSSAGPAIPYLFGLGSGVLSTDDPEVYDPRRDGLTVRATSIADARPAVAAGVLSPFVNGIAPVGVDAADPSVLRVLAFEDASWQTDFTTNGAFEVTVTADGAILGNAGGPTPSAAGFAQPAPTLVRVGDVALSVADPGSVIPAPEEGIEGVRYVALFTDVAGGARVTGFAAVFIATATPGVDGQGNPTLVLAGSKLASLVAPENASAVPALATDLSVQLAPSPARESLLAPVLAR